MNKIENSKNHYQNLTTARVWDWMVRLVGFVYFAWWSILYKASATRLERLSRTRSLIASCKELDALNIFSRSYAFSPVSLEHKCAASKNRELLTRSVDLEMSLVSRRFINSVFNSSFDCMAINDEDLRMFLILELQGARRRYRGWLDEVKSGDFEDDTLIRLDILIEVVRHSYVLPNAKDMGGED